MSKLKPFVGSVREVYTTNVLVYAEDGRDAAEKVREAYDVGEIEFEFENLSDTEFYATELRTQSEYLKILNPEDAPTEDTHE